LLLIAASVNAQVNGEGDFPAELADEPADELADELADEFADDFALDEAITSFSDFYEDGLYRQAAVAATRALWLARINHGDESIEAALAQINLANAQARSGDHEAAVDSYERSIRRIEAMEGIVSPRLVVPLTGLGVSNNALGFYDRGLAAYHRALRLHHVESGLYNEDQMPIRDGLSETYMALGDLSDAEFQQEVQVTIMQQEYGNNIEKVLPPMFKLADWYKRTNQPAKEAYQYQTVARLVQNHADKNSPDQIEALRKLSDVYRRMNMPNESLRLLKRSVRLNAEAEEPDPLLAADIQVQLGDFYNLFGSRREARRYYLAAWNALDELGEQEVLLEEYFGAPVNLEGPPLPDVYPANSATVQRYLQQPNLFLDGYVTAKFDVNADGRVKDVRIIESEPSSLIDKKVSRALARQHYRPRIVDGKLTITTDEKLRHQFNYEPERDQEDNESDAGRLERPGSRQQSLQR
jgi:TonB family protein